MYSTELNVDKMYSNNRQTLSMMNYNQYYHINTYIYIYNKSIIIKRVILHACFLY